MASISPQDSPARKKQLRELFKQFDFRGDGKIGLSQLGDCLRVLGANPSERSIRQHMRQLHMCHTQRVSFDEVMAILDIVMPPEKLLTPSDMAEQLIYGLRFFDEQNTGYIPASRLVRVLTGCGERLTQEEVEELLVDRVNDAGLVNYIDFINAITAPK